MKTKSTVSILFLKKQNKTKQKHRDFPGGPVVKNLPSNAGDVNRSLVGEPRPHMSWDN